MRFRGPIDLSPVATDEATLLASAGVYKQHCASCHGLPGQPPTDYASTMYPKPTELFRGKGVSDDPPVGELLEGGEWHPAVRNASIQK